MSDDTDARAEEAKPATFADLKRRQLREQTVVLPVDGEMYALRFRALTGDAYDDLERAHPPTDADKAKHPSRDLISSPSTFPPALVAACLVDPDLTPAEVAELFDGWDKGTRDKLFGVAYDLCNASEAVTLGKGFDSTLLSLLRLATP